MDADLEIVDAEVVEELEPAGGPGGLLRRTRAVAANPRVQGALAATAGMLAGATALALVRRVGAVSPVGPQPGSGDLGRPSDPGRPGPGRPLMTPGTYIVHVRAVRVVPPPG
ncbi:hypothetical protein [Conexibacter sp. DBS9H8]|uniref:hypothetical protein n=1 Tax=Conexibacter sp. DBS9H8 TaxID=2937801 RepID=UPI00200FB110|nr:hypothetical protein [Conexibacter sp. DBS9H8]